MIDRKSFKSRFINSTIIRLGWKTINFKCQKAVFIKIQISIHKLMKTKKYLKKNFEKKFISLSLVFYVLLILFIVKLIEKLCFCVNYCKFNVIIKNNHYSSLFIEKIFVRVMNCKYLTKFNIIAVFNKLHIYLNNENLIIFITLMKAYKYHILLFDLLNESASYQYYMNNVVYWIF